MSNHQSVISAKETLTKVIREARKQNCQSLNDNDRCAYRGKNNSKCFVGMLLPDELYTPTMEHSSITLYANNKISRTMLTLGYNLELLIELQTIHDDICIEKWEEEFKDLCENYEVDYYEI